MSNKNSQRKGFGITSNDIGNRNHSNDIEVQRFDCNLYPKPTGKFEGAGEGQQRPDGVQAQDDEKMPREAQEKGRAYNGAAAKNQKNGNKAAGILQLSDKKNKKNKGGYLSIDDDEEDDFDEHEAALTNNFKNAEKENGQNSLRILSSEASKKGNLDHRLKNKLQILNPLTN